MRDLDDAILERRLREVLEEHLGALPLDLTVETLEFLHRQGRSRRGHNNRHHPHEKLLFQ